MSLKGADTLPRIVAWLGYGGLLPFAALAIAAVGASFLGQDPHWWNAALVAYGVVILSFVGALHWGFAMTQLGLTDRQRASAFVWSVVPALVAWLALLSLLGAPSIAAAVLVTGFLAHYWRDVRLARAANLPAWYLPMRLRLTTVACLCLAAPPLAQPLLA